jgi:hypothetical protein
VLLEELHRLERVARQREVVRGFSPSTAKDRERLAAQRKV